MAQKTIWKRWYLIVLYVFVGLMILGALLPDSNNSQTNTNSQNSNSENQVTQNENSIQENVKTYGLEEILPSMSDFPTEYNRGEAEEVESDNGNLKAYDTNNGFVKGKSFFFSKYEVGTYSVKDYFDVEIMFYEFKKLEDAINFKRNIEIYMKEQGGYSEIKLNVGGSCFNTKEDFGYAGGNVASSVCQEGNIIYWTTLSITNSFKDSEDYIEEFIEVVEKKF